MPSSPQPSPNGQRECSQCPSWVLRCAHWEGQVLSLTGPFNDTYGVHGPAVGRSGEYCHNCYAAGDSLPAAEAEFERRNLELMGREAVHDR